MSTGKSLLGTVIVITGGANGLGRATAHALAHEGAAVAIADLAYAGPEDAAAQISPTTLGRTLDVTDSVAYTRFLDEVERTLGPVDVLINNAGLMLVGDLVHECDARINRQLDVMVRAVLLGTREAARRMRTRGRGHIINIASVGAKMPGPQVATYTAAKHAVDGLTKSVREELRGTGVAVSTVLPGLIRTQLVSGLRIGGLSSIGPDDAADYIVRLVRRPRPEMYLPWYYGAIFYLLAVLPRVVRDWLLRRASFDVVDPEARRRYEARVMGPEPRER